MLAVYLVVTFTVATVLENLGVTTGFPFGHGHYTGTSLRIGNVPVDILVIYCILGMACWLVAAALLDGADRRLADRSDPARRINLVALPVLAAALMAMYDLGGDSVASTVTHGWIWENGGGVFGVPWTNYVGWWFLSYVFFQIFALVLARWTPGDLPVADHRREPLVYAVVIYVLLAAGSVSGFITAPHGTVTDQAGITWSIHAIYESMFVINLFGTFVMAALAATKLARNDLALHGP